MERRLINAYDHMTMPDHCVQKLERQLQQTEENRKAGYYTKIMVPEPEKRYGWLRVATVTCLVLALMLGGSVFLLQQLQRAEPAAMAEPETQEEIPWDYYAEATTRPADEVETFAKIVRHNILLKNWDALEGKVKLPLTVQGEEVTNWDDFVEWMEAYSTYYLYTDRLKQETCHAMFCNWQGIAMADGLIWINEGGTGLKITAINMEVEPEPENAPQQKQVPEVFEPLLVGEPVKFEGFDREMSLEDYCAALVPDAQVNHFAVVDMDGDDVCEIVVSAQTVESSAYHLVLRQVGEELRGYSFAPGEMLNLKKDGTYGRRDREYRLLFNDKESWNMWYTEELRNQPEKPLAQWYAYPCQRPDLLLRACEFETGTSWNSFPGIPYSYFESIVQGRASNDLQVFQYWGIDHAVVEGDAIYILDPDAPGTVIYGTLTGEDGSQQFTQLGFYMATEEKEYMAEVRNMLSEEPEYWVDAHLSALGSMGRQVFSPEELIGYLGFTPMPDQETLQDQQAIWTLATEFVAVCLSGDPKDLEPYLAENAQGRIGKFPKGAVLELLEYDHLPDQAMGEWGRFTIWPSARIVGQEGQFQLHLGLVKQPDGWKVETYRVER